MASSNISQLTVPSLWNSANDDVVFEYSFNPYIIDSITSDGGNVHITISFDFDITPTPGEYVYINSNVYNGSYKILSVSGTTDVTLDLPYISGVTSLAYNCYHLRIPIFTLYKGFTITESYYTELPLEAIGDIKPPYLINNAGIPYISINVRGLVSRIFKPDFNIVNDSIDYSMFNGIRMYWDGITTTLPYTAYCFVLNSAISTAELLLKMGNGIVLSPIDTPYLSDMGMTVYSYMDAVTTVPKVKVLINGIAI